MLSFACCSVFSSLSDPPPSYPEKHDAVSSERGHRTNFDGPKAAAFGRLIREVERPSFGSELSANDVSVEDRPPYPFEVLQTESRSCLQDTSGCTVPDTSASKARPRWIFGRKRNLKAGKGSNPLREQQECAPSTSIISGPRDFRRAAHHGSTEDMLKSLSPPDLKDSEYFVLAVDPPTDVDPSLDRRTSLSQSTSTSTASRYNSNSEYEDVNTSLTSLTQVQTNSPKDYVPAMARSEPNVLDSPVLTNTNQETVGDLQDDDTILPRRHESLPPDLRNAGRSYGPYRPRSDVQSSKERFEAVRKDLPAPPLHVGDDSLSAPGVQPHIVPQGMGSLLTHQNDGEDVSPQKRRLNAPHAAGHPPLSRLEIVPQRLQAAASSPPSEAANFSMLDDIPIIASFFLSGSTTSLSYDQSSPHRFEATTHHHVLSNSHHPDDPQIPPHNTDVTRPPAGFSARTALSGPDRPPTTSTHSSLGGTLHRQPAPLKDGAGIIHRYLSGKPVDLQPDFHPKTRDSRLGRLPLLPKAAGQQRQQFLPAAAHDDRRASAPAPAPTRARQRRPTTAQHPHHYHDDQRPPISAAFHSSGAVAAAAAAASSSSSSRPPPRRPRTSQGIPLSEYTETTRRGITIAKRKPVPYHLLDNDDLALLGGVPR